MFENIRLSFQGIWSHKLRSFLTMLGIIIGIAAIIAIVSAFFLAFPSNVFWSSSTSISIPISFIGIIS